MLIINNDSGPGIRITTSAAPLNSSQVSRLITFLLFLLYSRMCKSPTGQGEAVLKLEPRDAYKKMNLAMKIAQSTHRLTEISLYLPVPAFNAT